MIIKKLFALKYFVHADANADKIGIKLQSFGVYMLEWYLILTTVVRKLYFHTF